MNLFEYIKSQLPSMPNVSIMKDMGASDELIEYIRETPWNTNAGILGVYGCEPEGDASEGEVWATITKYEEGYVTIYEDETKNEDGGTTNKTYAEWRDVFSNRDNYELSIESMLGTLILSYNEEDFAYVDENDSCYIYDEETQISITAGAMEESGFPFNIIVLKK